MKLTRDHITNVVRGYFEDKPVNKVWLFGSYARNEADNNSDIDILVDVDYKENVGIDYFIWFQDLQEVLNKKVDVVSRKYMNRRLRPFIEKDMVLVYEKN